MEVSTLKRDECLTEFKSLETTDPDDYKMVVEHLDESTICTKNKIGSGSCVGDSGGPLVGHNNTLIGIVSWSIGCADGFPNVYTNVYRQLDWINEQIAEMDNFYTKRNHN